MSRLNAPGGALIVKPQNNVYTAMALIGFLASLGALIYALVRFKELGLF